MLVLAKGAVWDEGLSQALRADLEKDQEQGSAGPRKISSIEDQKAYFRKRGKVVVEKD